MAPASLLAAVASTQTLVGVVHSDGGSHEHASTQTLAGGVQSEGGGLEYASTQTLAGGVLTQVIIFLAATVTIMRYMARRGVATRATVVESDADAPDDEEWRAAMEQRRRRDETERLYSEALRAREAAEEAEHLVGVHRGHARWARLARACARKPSMGEQVEDDEESIPRPLTHRRTHAGARSRRRGAAPLAAVVDVLASLPLPLPTDACVALVVAAAVAAAAPHIHVHVHAPVDAARVVADGVWSKRAYFTPVKKVSPPTASMMPRSCSMMSMA